MALGILYHAPIEKRRDGAIRGGWSQRTLVLCGNGLYYFRKLEPKCFLGEERGQIFMKDILQVQSLTAEECHEQDALAYFSIQTTVKTIHVRVDQEDMRTEWMKRIEFAMEVGAGNGYAQVWSSEDQVKFAKQEFMGGKEDEAMKEEPKVVLVTVVNGKDRAYRERVVARCWKESLDIDCIAQDGVCCILLDSGHVVELKMEDMQLMASTGENSQLRGEHHGRNVIVLVSATCKDVPKKDVMRDPLKKNTDYAVRVPILLASIYLVAYLLAITCSPAETKTLNVVLLVGVLLACTQLVRYKSAVEQWTTRKESMDVVEEFSFSLHLESVKYVCGDQEWQQMSPKPKMVVPRRFIAAEKGNTVKARNRYLKTMQWRKAERVDDILMEMHPHFTTIKKYYPQYFHGRSRENNPVYYEQPGKINLKALKAQGITMDTLMRHYIYSTEFLWSKIEPSDDAKGVSVLDVSGIGMSDVVGEVKEFIQNASSISSAHYPERSARIFIVNIPSWFSMIWKAISGFIDPVTREKIKMVRSHHIFKELSVFIAEDQIPSEYGGSGPSLGNSTEETMLRDHVALHSTPKAHTSTS